MATKKRNTTHHPVYSVTLNSEGVFLICFEVQQGNQCFTSLHPPSMDVRYKRNLKPVASHSKMKDDEKIWDNGTYAITKMKAKTDIEAAFEERLKENKLSLVLDGDRLKGRFAIHKDDTGWHIYKYKDKYAREEDPLSGELQRSISKWHISKEDIEAQQVGERKRRPVRKDTHQREKNAEEEITPLLKLDEKEFHFHFYSELTGEGLVCIINEASMEPFVMKEGKRNQWKIITPVPDDVAGLEKKLAGHARKLLNKQRPQH